MNLQQNSPFLVTAVSASFFTSVLFSAIFLFGFNHEGLFWIATLLIESIIGFKSSNNLLIKSKPFLSKHRLGNPSKETIYFIRDSRGNY